MARANGEGSEPVKLGSGRWQSKYTVYVDGVRKRRNVYGKSKTECNRNLRKALADRDGDRIFDSKNLSVEEFMTRWLEDSVRGSVKIATYDDYAKTTRRYIVPEIGRIKLNKLTPDHIQRVYAKKLREGLSPNTVLHIHRTLRRALNQATRWKLIPENPVELTDPPRKTKPKLKVLSAEEIERFVRVSAERRLFPLYMTAALTGLRAGELLGLKWRDIVPDANGRPVIRIERTLVNSSDGLVLQESTKGGEDRVVALNRLCEAILRIHREKQLEEKSKRGAAWGTPSREDRDLVFTSKTGHFVHPTNVSQYLRRDLVKAGLPEIRFHDLRHSFATMLAGAGAHLAIISGMLGHKDMTVTLNTYTHYLPTMQDWALQRLDELFPESLLSGEHGSPKIAELPSKNGEF